MLPDVVVHADWSGPEPKKRVAATARRLPDDRYSIEVPQEVRANGSGLERLGVPAGTSGTALIGFDFVIGIPVAYARKTGITSFRDALVMFGEGDWRDFYNVCRNRTEISLHRPFFPYSPGGRSRTDLTTALGMNWDDLHRQCERKTADRPAACPLFWTHGPNQVGRSALSGWREVVQPMLSQGDHVGLWPFDAPLADLLQSRSCVIVETYPAEFYGHLGVRLANIGGKRSQQARQQNAKQLLAEAAGVDAELTDPARHALTTGFPDGDDHFDAMVGLMGILKHLRSGSNIEPPLDHDVRSIEGWMLGQKPAP